MRSKSNALNNLNPYLSSALMHTGLIAALLGAVYLHWAPDSESVDIEVIDAPSLAKSPVRPMPIAQPKIQPKSEARQVFGLSRKAITTDNPEAISAKAGNTVAKTPDQTVLKDSDADSLPIPSDEYLVTKMPELISDFRVPYPPEARKKGIQGAVIFDLLIDDQGKVRQANLVEGPGSGLNEAAAQAISKLVFKPAMIEAKTVAVRIRYAYRFVLER